MTDQKHEELKSKTGPRELLWFAALWAGGVGVVLALAMGIRLALGL